MKMLTHSSITVSIGAGAILAAASTIRPVPWPLWAAWAALSGIALRQAWRDSHA